MDVKPIRCAWVVDDDPLQVLLLNRLLTAHKAVQTTKIFSGAKAAFEMMNSLKAKPDELPGLVFLDLFMAKGDGWEFLEQHKKLKSKVKDLPKVIVISSFNDDNLIRLKQFPDVISFLSKPIDIKKFDEVLDEVAKSIKE